MDCGQILAHGDSEQVRHLLERLLLFLLIELEQEHLLDDASVLALWFALLDSGFEALGRSVLGLDHIVGHDFVYQVGVELLLLGWFVISRVEAVGEFAVGILGEAIRVEVRNELLESVVLLLIGLILIQGIGSLLPRRVFRSDDVVCDFVFHPLLELIDILGHEHAPVAFFVIVLLCLQFFRHRVKIERFFSCHPFEVVPHFGTLGVRMNQHEELLLCSGSRRFDFRPYRAVPQLLFLKVIFRPILFLLFDFHIMRKTRVKQTPHNHLVLLILVDEFGKLG